MGLILFFSSGISTLRFPSHLSGRSFSAPFTCSLPSTPLNVRVLLGSLYTLHSLPTGPSSHAKDSKTRLQDQLPHDSRLIDPAVYGHLCLNVYHRIQSWPTQNSDSGFPTSQICCPFIPHPLGSEKPTLHQGLLSKWVTEQGLSFHDWNPWSLVDSISKIYCNSVHLSPPALLAP